MTKKVLAVVLAAAMLLTFVPFAFAANEASDGYTITNPYKDINWETVNQYKTALHTHTNASDGDDTLVKSLERHYETGYDVVAITDHGISNTSWTASDANIVTDVMALIGKTDGNIITLQNKGAFDNGTAYEVINRNGDDYLVTADGKEILRIPYGIENNALSVNAHVNSWFAPFEYNLPSDYHEAITGVDKAGGISVINHPGEYTQARYELYQEDAYSLDNWSYRYYFNKFYGYIDKYDSCIGIDINSKGDGRTRYDRKLWDLMLAEAATEGSTVTAIATSDAHQLDKIDTGSLIVLAEENTTANIKNALIKGEVLPQSTCIANRDELAQIADGIKTYYGETELYTELTTLVAQYDADREEIIKSNDDGQVSVSYTALDDEGYHSTGIKPVINSITVNESEDTITIDSDNALIIRWISDGKLIATTKADDTAFDLNDYENQLKGYVRAEIFGEGGIIYTEGFTLNADEAAGDGNDTIFNLGFLDFLFAMIDRYSRYLGRVFENII
ncbi:MAG: hypothetical protein U0L11_00335 [Acutalibacteraceae bacterium]|nr:hypothetical protein [Acutalibacteraceae bacterium]